MGAFDFDPTIIVGSIVQLKIGSGNFVVDSIFNGIATVHVQSGIVYQEMIFPLYQLLKIA